MESMAESHILSGSNDKRIRVWKLHRDLIDKHNLLFGLKLESQREHTVQHEIFVLRVSPDGRFIVAALSNNVVLVLFFDSFKVSHHLHGFHMPVECLSISSDSELLATGSGDRIIRIWSLRHGTMEHMLDKHHTEKITGLAFQTNSHILFSCDFAGVIIQWNAQKFHRILTLKGHKAGCTGLGVSTDGKWVVTSSTDYSLRLWRESDDEIVILEDEEIEQQLRDEEANVLCHEQLVTPGIDSHNAAVAVLAKKTGSSLRAEEFVRDTLDILCDANANENNHPLLLAHGCSDFEELVMTSLCRVRLPELELCIATLPWLPHAYRLLSLMRRFVLRWPWMCELFVRVVAIITHVHADCLLHAGAVSLPDVYKQELDEDNEDVTVAGILANFRDTAEQTLMRQKKMVGFNLSAWEYAKMITADDVEFEL